MAADRPPRLRRPAKALLRWAAGLLVVLSLLFLLTTALPGDAADTIAGADAARAQAVRARLGLDAPAPIRLVGWWSGVFHGDLGVSLVSGGAVLPQVASRLAATLLVAAPAVALATPAAVALALVQAWYRGHRSGRLVAAGVALVAALPEVVLVVGLVLLLAVRWRLVPAVSLPPASAPIWSQPDVLVLPILCLTLPSCAWGARTLRGSADDLLATHVVDSTRTRGVGALRIVTCHVLPRWWGPIAQMSALLAAGVLGGSAVVETLLAYPGLGQALATAVASHDTPMVQGVGVIVVTVSLTLLTLADLVDGGSRFSQRQAER